MFCYYDCALDFGLLQDIVPLVLATCHGCISPRSRGKTAILRLAACGLQLAALRAPEPPFVWSQNCPPMTKQVKFLTRMRRAHSSNGATAQCSEVARTCVRGCGSWWIPFVHISSHDPSHHSLKHGFQLYCSTNKTYR
ncbi:hypothetical protein M3J07_004279 [Ascochyta lentis]